MRKRGFNEMSVLNLKVVRDGLNGGDARGMGRYCLGEDGVWFVF